MLKTSNDTLTSTLNNTSEAMLNMIKAIIKATENLSQPIQARNQKFCRAGEVSWNQGHFDKHFDINTKKKASQENFF